MLGYALLIKADVNDADYVYSYDPISDEELKRVIPIIEKLEGVRHNWEHRERLLKGFPEEDIAILEDMMPATQDCEEIHTVDEINLIEVVSFKKLL